MSLGLFASAASIARLIFTTHYVSQQDPLWGVIIPAIWGSIEEYLAIFAACVPFLRVPFEKCLGRMGLLTSNGSTTEEDGRSYKLSPLNGSNTGRNAIRTLGTGDKHFGPGQSTEILCDYKA
jgi:hypothetical protein